MVVGGARCWYLDGGISDVSAKMNLDFSITIRMDTNERHLTARIPPIVRGLMGAQHGVEGELSDS